MTHGVRFRRIVRSAGREDEVSAALKLILEGFGNPHAHSGLGIRKLGKHLYECRAGLACQRQLSFTLSDN
jgi:hypothetical protein